MIFRVDKNNSLKKEDAESEIVPFLFIYKKIGYSVSSWKEFVKIAYSLIIDDCEEFENNLKAQLYHYSEINNHFKVIQNYSLKEKKDYVKINEKYYVYLSKMKVNNFSFFRKMTKNIDIPDYTLYLHNEGRKFDVDKEISNISPKPKKIKKGNRVCSYINGKILSKEEKFYLRIVKKFKDPKTLLIGDITIEESEKIYLDNYMAYAIERVLKDCEIRYEEVFAYGLVYYATYYYNSNGVGAFWPYLEKTFRLTDFNASCQNKIYHKYIKIMKNNNKEIHDTTKNTDIGNIIMHSFVPNSETDKFNKMLYVFWENDIKYDIDMMKYYPETFDALIRRIKTRKNNCVFAHTEWAVEVNEKGCKLRIKNIIKAIERMMSNANEIERGKKSPKRLIKCLAEWIEKSKEVKETKKRNIYTLKRKLLHSPDICYDDKRNEFKVVINRQSFENDIISDSSNYRWLIECNGVEFKSGELITLKGSAYNYTEEVEVKINPEQIFDEIVVYVTIDSETKRYPIHTGKCLFFEPSFDNRYYLYDVECKERIPEGNMICFTIGSDIPNPFVSVYSTFRFGNLYRTDYVFDDEDIVVMPNGKAYKVGKTLMSEGVVGGKRLQGAYIEKSEFDRIDVYSKLPSIFFKTKNSNIVGTSLSINGEFVKVKNRDYKVIKLDDSLSDVHGYIIDLKDYIQKDGKYDIALYVQNSHPIMYEFVYVGGMSFEFNKKFYFYDEKISMAMSKCKYVNYKNEYENGYWQELESKNIFSLFLDYEKRNSVVDKGELEFEFTINEKKYSLIIDVPIILWKFEKDDNWHIKKPVDIFLKSFNKKLILFSKVDLTDSYIWFQNEFRFKDETIVTPKQIDGCFEYDIQEYKNYQDSDEIKNLSLNLQFGNNSVNLFKTYFISFIVGEPSIDFDQVESKLFGNFTIHGNGEYSVDILKNKEIIEKDIQLDDGKFEMDVSDFSSGKYEICVNEIELDEFGIDQTSNAIYRKTIYIQNTSNMTQYSIVIHGLVSKNGLEEPIFFRNKTKISSLKKLSISEDGLIEIIYPDAICHFNPKEIIEKYGNEITFYSGNRVDMDGKPMDRALLVFYNKSNYNEAIILFRNKNMTYSLPIYDYKLNCLFTQAQSNLVDDFKEVISMNENQMFVFKREEN